MDRYNVQTYLRHAKAKEAKLESGRRKWARRARATYCLSEAATGRERGAEGWTLGTYGSLAVGEGGESRRTRSWRWDGEWIRRGAKGDVGDYGAAHGSRNKLIIFTF